MAKLIYQNTSIVALNEQQVSMRDGSARRKLEIQLTENSREGTLIIGGIEAWDDSIDQMGLVVGTNLSELHCRAISRYKDGKWWWSVQAYKAVKGEAASQSIEGEEDPFKV